MAALSIDFRSNLNIIIDNDECASPGHNFDQFLSDDKDNDLSAISNTFQEKEVCNKRTLSDAVNQDDEYDDILAPPCEKKRKHY